MAVIKSVRTMTCKGHALTKRELSEFLEPLEDGTLITIETEYGTGQRGDELSYNISAKI